MGTSAITGINLGVPAFILPFVDGDLSSGVLTVNHNLNAQYISVTVINNSNQIVIPDQVTMAGANACTVDLTSYGTLTGTWRVVVLDTGATMNSVASDLSLAGQTTGDRVVFDGSNWVRKPAAAFRAYIGTTMSSIAINTEHDIQFDTEVFDVGGNFNTGTYTFTAPVDGIYHFEFRVRLDNIDSASTEIVAYLYASNTPSSGLNRVVLEPDRCFDADVGTHTIQGSVIHQLSAGDTAKVTITKSGGAAQMDVKSDPVSSYFAGYLIA